MIPQNIRTRGTAVRVLLGQWLISACAISILILLQSIFGKYGNDSEVAWSWMCGLFVPPLSLLLTAALTESSIDWHNQVASTFKYWVAFGAGGVCILAVAFILLIEPVVSLSYFQLFEKTSLALALWQGFSVAAISAVVFEGR